MYSDDGTDAVCLGDFNFHDGADGTPISLIHDAGSLPAGSGPLVMSELILFVVMRADRLGVRAAQRF